MTTETILTPEQVDVLLEGVLRASGSRLGNYTYQKTLDELRSSIRAIEQAVLQSPEMQALRKDAGRYKFIRSKVSASNMDPLGRPMRQFHYDRLPDPIGNPLKGSVAGHLDDAIDASMEKQS